MAAMSVAAIGIICKAPQPGRSKTRLATAIGVVAASELSACFLRDVATAIEKIVSTPAGSRPDRVVVGLPFGSDAVNNAVAPIQRGVIEKLGLGDLTKLKIS